MPPTLVIAKKELKGYFTSPIAYVYLTAFLVLSHWLFFRTFFINGQDTMRNFFGLTPWILLFFIPATAMGKWSEEKQKGTEEILFTLPLREEAILMGKFLSGALFIGFSILLTLPLAFLCSELGPLEWGPVIGGYIALILLAFSYLAIGLFASALTKNQIVAFILGVVFCFVFFILGESVVLSNTPSFLVPLFDYLSVQTHYESLARGVVDSRDLVFYLSLIALFLFFNRLVLAKR